MLFDASSGVHVPWSFQEAKVTVILSALFSERCYHSISEPTCCSPPCPPNTPFATTLTSDIS